MQICIPDSASADVFLVLLCKCPSIWVFREFVILNLSVRFRVLHHAFLVITASKASCWSLEARRCIPRTCYHWQSPIPDDGDNPGLITPTHRHKEEKTRARINIGDCVITSSSRYPPIHHIHSWCCRNCVLHSFIHTLILDSFRLVAYLRSQLLWFCRVEVGWFALVVVNHLLNEFKASPASLISRITHFVLEHKVQG